MNSKGLSIKCGKFCIISWLIFSNLSATFPSGERTGDDVIQYPFGMCGGMSRLQGRLVYFSLIPVELKQTHIYISKLYKNATTVWLANIIKAA